MTDYAKHNTERGVSDAVLATTLRKVKGRRRPPHPSIVSSLRLRSLIDNGLAVEVSTLQGPRVYLTEAGRAFVEANPIKPRPPRGCRYL